MSVTTPEELARNIVSDGVACTDTDVANRLLTHLRHAQAMGSPDSPAPLEVFARAGGVAALAAAMKANTPVAADWPKGTRPASGIDLAMVQKEGCGVLNNIAASALAGGAATASGGQRGSEFAGNDGVSGLKRLGVRDLTYKPAFLACAVQPADERFGATNIRGSSEGDEEATQQVTLTLTLP